ncbi:putative glucosyltransferase [Colletotrichum sublineola]|uniref:Putative glucosyltransferase n=1 Tax=Colletotrichum sublineola TaxID=1173701 RepID=A0A066XZI0_COLSU|nr:putative glucosyltransferase [Colletotrichum sublineola]
MLMPSRLLSQCWIDTLRKLCDDSGRAWPRPTALMLDHTGPLPTLPVAKQIVGPECKTFMYWPGSAARLYSYLAPSNKGGFSDWEATVDKYYMDETLRMGRDRGEIAEAVCTAKNGTDKLIGMTISIPGLKDMYDYEREFGEVPMRSVVSRVLQETTSLVKSTDAIICASAVALEGETLTACKKYAAVYPVGIQIPPRGWLKNTEQSVIHDEKLRMFLNGNDSGSVILISFGSIVFPTNLSALWILTSTLEKIGHPFVLVLGGLLVNAKVYATDLARIRAGGIGFVCETWVDQLAVLQHPAVGWLVAHGGFNSAVESLVQGIPLVGWPLAPGDNAINVAMLSTRDKPVAFELMQIRTGSAKEKPKRGGPRITGTDESIRREIEDIVSRMMGPEGLERHGAAKKVSTFKIASPSPALKIASPSPTFKITSLGPPLS